MLVTALSVDTDITALRDAGPRFTHSGGCFGKAEFGEWKNKNEGTEMYLQI